MANDEQLQHTGEGRPAASLAGRLRVALGQAARLPEPFDTKNPGHVDAAARPLLRRFYERGDARCFDLLVESTFDAVAPAALDVVREVGLPLSDDMLLGILYGALFCDTRPAQVDVRDFVAFAERKLRALAEARVKWLAARPIPQLERLPSGLPEPRAPYPGAPLEDDPPEQPVLLDRLVPSGAPAVAVAIDFDRLGFEFTWLVETLFHRLSQEDRVVLRAAEIEGMSPAQFAERSEMDVSAATARFDAARAALSTSIEDVCTRLAGKARRAGCTLAGKHPEDITAEDVAKHLVACDACVQALDSVTDAQKQALVVLGSARDPGASKVGALIAGAQAKGKEALADFLAELARACLLQVPDLRLRCEQPDSRPAAEIRVGIGALGSRTLASSVDAGEQIERDCVDAARSCVVALATIEGDTGRVVYLRALVAFSSKDHASARDHLVRLLATSAHDSLHSFAEHFLVTVLGELNDHAAVVTLCRRMVASSNATRAAWFGLWRSLAHLGLWDESQVAARRFRSAPLEGRTATAWALQVRTAASEVGAALQADRAGLEEQLGLRDLEEDGR